MWCASAVALVERAFSAGVVGDAERRVFPLNSAIPTTLPANGVPMIESSRQIRVEDARALTTTRFYSDYVATETPVVIRGHLGANGENWAALDAFKNLDVFEKYADTIVPVEYGTAFDSHGVGVTTLGSFARDFLAPSNAARDGAPSSEKVAYVSQHPIFHQIPELQRTFTVIPYTLGRLRVETSAVNLWLGTSGTRTAIHRDPYLNLLCQVSGFKYVRIYAASETPHLYVADTDVLRGSNVNSFTRSPVDPESPSVAREHPRALDAAFLETVLAPGDVLFMPKGHWHYVRALTSSVSVNFWF
jgi:lysine-specific demethylase 8